MGHLSSQIRLNLNFTQRMNDSLSKHMRNFRASSLALNLETATAKNAELSEQLQLAIVSRDLLTDELAQLRPLANAVDINVGS